MSYTPSRPGNESCLSILIEAIVFVVCAVILIGLASFVIMAGISLVMWVVGM